MSNHPPHPLGLHDFMPGAATEGYTARAGASKADLKPPPKQAIISALSSVFDPEIPVNIYDLGLIYDITIKDNADVYITMSLTAPGCPVAGILPQQAADAVALLDAVGLVEVELIWDPPWTIDRMSADARLALDL